MSRAKQVDNSATVSLFPFLAVLLCTMGALLVVLVAMTRSARTTALRRAEAQSQPPVVDIDVTAKKEIDEVNLFVSQIDQIKREALQKLHEDQQRMSHLEDHMRRLQDQLEKLRVATAELDALEGEHYDDREQAEREVERLQQLIASTREAIESLKQEQTSKKRSYALVPYEGPHGTTRRPIYLECRQGEIVMQPEGVRITRDDLRPPLGAGNPLASALRAARDYMIRMHPEEGQNLDTEPYPLIIVRPSGATIYGIAQRAIHSSDFQFGYELVEEDWELKYPAADPQLALVEQRAIEQARIRQYALAAAAPRAYRHPALAAAGRFDEFGDGADGFGGWEDGDSPESGGGLPGAEGGPGESTEHDGAGGAGANGNGGGAGGSQYGTSATNSGQGSPGVNNEGEPNSLANNKGDSSGATTDGDTAAGTAGGASNQVAAGGTAQQPTAGAAEGGTESRANSGGPASDTPSVVQMNSPDQQHEMDLSAARGDDWALKQKKPRAIPVRRTISVIVRNHHLAILSDDVQPHAPAPAAKTIPLERDTVESIDAFVAAVQNQIEGWGMAGDGLYWRPVLSLHVGPDGHRRAQDLARLLKNSGLELQPAAATNPKPQGNSRAARSR
jgi:hypothetical protein